MSAPAIQDVTVFISTSSRACRMCLEMFKRYRVPAQIVRLDTQEARDIAQSGEFFQITHVPTMVVTYEDGNTQLFMGAPKIESWVASMVRPQRAPEPEPEPDFEPDSMTFTKVPKVKKAKKAEAKKIVIDDYESEEEEEAPPPPKAKSSKKKKSKKSKKSVIVFEEPEEEEAPLFAPPKPLGSGKPSRMKDLYHKAKQMEEDMKNSLGYDEKNLPKF
jgi:hypothetical protein